MNLYMLDVYAAPHDGRTRTRYATAPNPATAVLNYHNKHPDHLVRTVWEFVPPTDWTHPSTVDTTEDADPKENE